MSPTQKWEARPTVLGEILPPTNTGFENKPTGERAPRDTSRESPLISAISAPTCTSSS